MENQLHCVLVELFVAKTGREEEGWDQALSPSQEQRESFQKGLSLNGLEGGFLGLRNR